MADQNQTHRGRFEQVLIRRRRFEVDDCAVVAVWAVFVGITHGGAIAGSIIVVKTGCPSATNFWVLIDAAVRQATLTAARYFVFANRQTDAAQRITIELKAERASKIGWAMYRPRNTAVDKGRCCRTSRCQMGTTLRNT